MAQAHDDKERLRHTLTSGAISIAAIILFVAIASSVLSATLRHYFAGAAPVEQPLIVALLLNVALILFGWRRHDALVRELAERAETEERVRRLAACDPLTGMLNRRSLVDDGAALLADAGARNRQVALLMIDLDHFKAVNDRHGHAAGDALLRAVADGIVATAPDGAIVARPGGDEFTCVFAFDPGGPAAVTGVAERIIARMAQPFDTGGVCCHVGASIGIAHSDAAHADIDALMRRADIAMYAAKRSGRNRFAWFDRSMEQELRLRGALEDELRAAIPRGEVIPYFEPQVDMAAHTLCGFEVLARWEHPQHGLIGPDVFIPIAEDTGSIGDLSLSIMRQALAVACDWHPSLVVSINVSPWQLRDPWLAQKILKVLAETGFAPHRFEVEITETALFDNLPLARSIMGGLKNQGVRLALDDFGTGYSSLAHLRALPFDRIKIDKSFVASMVEVVDSAAIVGAIARLGESLNLPIMAEGVENAEIEQRLVALGIGKGQGWLYGKPLPIAGVRRLLAEQRMDRASAA